MDHDKNAGRNHLTLDTGEKVMHVTQKREWKPGTIISINKQNKRDYMIKYSENKTVRRNRTLMYTNNKTKANRATIKAQTHLRKYGHTQITQAKQVHAT